MDEIALYEIYEALKKAKARMRKIALVCKDCGREMEVDDRFAKCQVCDTFYPLRTSRKPWH